MIQDQLVGALKERGKQKKGKEKERNIAVWSGERVPLALCL